MGRTLVGRGLAVSGPDDPVRSEATLGDGGLEIRPRAEAGAEALLLPGLVNLHDHLRGFVPSGRSGERRSLADAISVGNQAQLVAEPRDYEALTALASARQLLAGVTTVVDHVYPLHRDGLLEAVVAGHAQVGIRGAVALGIQTAGVEEFRVPVPAVAALAARAADVLLPKEQLFLAPVSLGATDLADYAAAALAADELGVGLYTHIAETPGEVERCLGLTGKRPVEFLHASGFLGPRTVLVHGVQLDDHEIDLVARTGTTLVYCPSNHLRFAKGFAPVVDFLAAGGRVGLGVDGMESLFHEMRYAVFAQGQAQGRAGALSSETVFRMATDVGAEVLGLPGSPASQDLVCLDARDPELQPLVDPLWSVVHRATPRNVTDVVVAGRHVVRDRSLVDADLVDLATEAGDALTRLAHRAGASTPGVFRLRGQAEHSQIGMS